jgi:hypothetical protein
LEQDVRRGISGTEVKVATPTREWTPERSRWKGMNEAQERRSEEPDRGHEACSGEERSLEGRFEETMATSNRRRRRKRKPSRVHQVTGKTEEGAGKFNDLLRILRRRER